MEYPRGRKLLAEGIGTFALVFVGAGSIIYGIGGLVGVALAHGLTIAVMVSAMGHISGGHFNPAVTLGALVARKIEGKTAVLYILAQLFGAALAAMILADIFPQNPGAGFPTNPAGWPGWGSTNIGNPEPAAWLVDNGKVILVEAVLTFFLVWVIFGTAIDKRGSWNAVGGLAIGLTVTLDILVGGPLTGAAMNPARSFGPTVVASGLGVREVVSGGVGLWQNHLLYWIGPVLGGIMAGGLYSGLYLPEEEE